MPKKLSKPSGNAQATCQKDGHQRRRPKGLHTPHRKEGGDTPGVIRDDETLSIAAFCERMGMSRQYVIRNLSQVIRGSSYHAVIS